MTAVPERIVELGPDLAIGLSDIQTRSALRRAAKSQVKSQPEHLP